MRHFIQVGVVALVFGNLGCATPDDDAGVLVVKVKLNGTSSSFLHTGANTWSINGAVLVTGADDEGAEELRLRAPNEKGTYTCRAGSPSVDIQYRFPTAPGYTKSAVVPVYMDDPQWDCTITLSEIGDDTGKRWEGSFSGELYIDDPGLPMEERRNSARDGHFSVERAAQ